MRTIARRFIHPFIHRVAGPALAAALLAPPAGAQSPAAVPASPVLRSPSTAAAAEAFQETRHGLAIDDPYRWMEQPARAEAMKAWLTAATAESMAPLAAWPTRASWTQRVSAAVQPGTAYSSPVVVGQRLFLRRTRAGEAQASLVVREGPGRAERVVFDPAREPGLAINRYSVSPDGRTVALVASSQGSEVGAMRFVDVATGREKGTRLAPVWGEFTPSWLDDRRVLITRMGDGRAGDPMQTMVAVLTDLGARPRPLFGHGLKGTAATELAEFPGLFPVPGSPFVLAGAGGARADTRRLVALRRDVEAGRPRWQPLAGYDDQVQEAVVRGRTAYLLTTKTRSAGTLVAVDLDAQGRPGARRTIDVGVDGALTGLAATRDGLYVTSTRDGVTELRWLPGGDGPGEALPLPFDAAVDGADSSADGRHLLLSLVGWTQPRSHFRVEGSRLLPLQADSEGWAPARRLTVTRLLARSADGTTVPMVVLRAPDAPPGPRPALVEAYGSYGIPTAEPLYLPPLLAWVDAGQVLAYCGTRGGNERGRDWHEGGRSANKPRAQADLIACGEALVAQGLTTPAQLAATGTSAGGLLSPLAAVQRPDLFRALVARVAILNATRLEAMANGPNQYAEMGDPRTEAGFKALAVQDAVLGLQAQARRQPRPDTPHLLVTLGLNDRRVDPWMPAKFAAHALALSRGDRLVLVRADGAQGHGVGSAARGVIDETVDILVFLEAVLGGTGATASTSTAR